MAGLMYFVPGAVGEAEANLSVFEGVLPDSRACTPVDVGPSGGSGLIVMPMYPATETPAGYVPEAQTWRACDGGAFWIGYWTDLKPGPDDLKRAEMERGYYVELSDGNRWVVPSVRLFPKALTLSASREIVKTAARRFRSLKERSEWLWNTMLEGNGEAGFQWLELMDYVCEFLHVNYHLDAWAASALELFDTDNIQRAAQLTIDFDTFLSALEKKISLNSPS